MFMNVSTIILIPKKNIDDLARFNQNQIESVLSPNKKEAGTKVLSLLIFYNLVFKTQGLSGL